MFSRPSRAELHERLEPNHEDANPRAAGSETRRIAIHKLTSCSRKGMRYSETIHVANRNRALGRAA
jgi:hypothetical protein